MEEKNNLENFLNNKKNRQCIFSSIGCNKEFISEEEIDNHNLEFFNKHMKLIIDKMNEIINENKEIRKQNHRIEKIISNLQAFHSYPISIKRKSKYFNHDENEEHFNQIRTKLIKERERLKKEKERRREKEKKKNKIINLERHFEKEKEINKYKKKNKEIIHISEDEIILSSEEEIENNNILKSLETNVIDDSLIYYNLLNYK